MKGDLYFYYAVLTNLSEFEAMLRLMIGWVEDGCRRGEGNPARTVWTVNSGRYVQIHARLVQA